MLQKNGIDQLMQEDDLIGRIDPTLREIDSTAQINSVCRGQLEMKESQLELNELIPADGI